MTYENEQYAQLQTEESRNNGHLLQFWLEWKEVEMKKCNENNGKQ